MGIDNKTLQLAVVLVRFALTDASFQSRVDSIYPSPHIDISIYGYVADSVGVECGIYTPSISPNITLVVKKRKGCRRWCPLAALLMSISILSS
jgi:hypothetical protein